MTLPRRDIDKNWLGTHSHSGDWTTCLLDTHTCARSLSLSLHHTRRSYLSQDEVLQPMLNPLYERNSSVLMLTVHTLNVVRVVNLAS